MNRRNVDIPEAIPLKKWSLVYEDIVAQLVQLALDSAGRLEMQITQHQKTLCVECPVASRDERNQRSMAPKVATQMGFSPGS